MTLESRSVMDKQRKRHLVADCLRAAAGFGLTEAQVSERCGVSRQTVEERSDGGFFRRGLQTWTAAIGQQAPAEGDVPGVCGRTGRNVRCHLRRRRRKDRQAGLREVSGQARYPVSRGELPGGQFRVPTGWSTRPQHRRRPSQADKGARRAPQSPTATRPITACRASCRTRSRLPLIPTLSC